MSSVEGFVDIQRIDAEIAAVQARIARLDNELDTARRWLSDLTTARAVVHKLHEPTSHVISAPSILTSHGKVVRVEIRKKGGPRRSDVVEQAGKALVQILTARESHLKPADAVTVLRDRFQLVVGSGVPGRETSDLSAALGNGKFPPLYVTRANGWGLTTWVNEIANSVGGANVEPEPDGEPDWDLELDRVREADEERQADISPSSR